jgi:hypothetical protein
MSEPYTPFALNFSLIPTDGSFDNREFKPLVMERFGATKATIAFRPKNTGRAIAWFPSEAILEKGLDGLKAYFLQAADRRLRQVKVDRATPDDLSFHLQKKYAKWCAEFGGPNAVYRKYEKGPRLIDEDKSEDELFVVPNEEASSGLKANSLRSKGITFCFVLFVLLGYIFSVLVPDVLDNNRDFAIEEKLSQSRSDSEDYQRERPSYPTESNRMYNDKNKRLQEKQRVEPNRDVRRSKEGDRDGDLRDRDRDRERGLERDRNAERVAPREKERARERESDRERKEYDSPSQMRDGRYGNERSARERDVDIRYRDRGRGWERDGNLQDRDQERGWEQHVAPREKKEGSRGRDGRQNDNYFSREDRRQYGRGEFGSQDEDEDSYEYQERRPAARERRPEPKQKGYSERVSQNFRPAERGKPTRNQGRSDRPPEAYARNQLDSRDGNRRSEPETAYRRSEPETAYRSDESDDVSDSEFLCDYNRISKMQKQRRATNQEYRELEDYIHYLVQSGIFSLSDSLFSFVNVLDKLRTENFFCLSFGPYCYHAKSNVAIPCEIAVTKFTIGKGESANFTHFIDPGDNVPEELSVCLP